MDFKEPPPPYIENALPSAPPAYFEAQEPRKSDPATGLVWMPEGLCTAPPLMLNLCEGPLRWLEAFDGLVIKPHYQLNGMNGRRTITKLDIVNTQGQLLLSAEGPQGTFIKDLRGNDIIALRRTVKDSMKEMVIESPPGLALGKTTQDGTLLYPELSIRDGHNKQIFRISSTAQGGDRSHESHFHIVEARTCHVIGRVVETWTGSVWQQSATVAHFNVSFPRETPVQHKALLTSAVLHLSFLSASRTGPLREVRAQVRSPRLTAPTTRVGNTVRTSPERSQEIDAECISGCCDVFLSCLQMIVALSVDSSRGGSSRGTTTTSNRSSGGRTTTTFSSGGSTTTTFSSGGSTTTTFS